MDRPQVVMIHKDTVRCIIPLSNGTILTGSDDHTLRIGTPPKGKNLGKTELILKGHTGPVYSAAVLPDGRIVSGSQDMTLRVWNSKTGVVERIIRGSSFHSCLLALPDNRIVTTAPFGTMEILNVDTGAVEQTLNGHSEAVEDIALLPDGRIVSGSRDATLRIWNTETGKTEQIVKNRSAVKCLLVLRNGNIVSGSEDSLIRIWNLAPDSENPERLLRGHEDSITCVAELPDRRIVSGAQDWTLRIWNIETGEIEQVFTDHWHKVWSVAVVKDRIYSGSSDKTMRIRKYEMKPTNENRQRKTNMISELNFMLPRDILSSYPGGQIYRHAKNDFEAVKGGTQRYRSKRQNLTKRKNKKTNVV